MRHAQARAVALTAEGARALMARLARDARAAALRKDWRACHRLCREHDDLAMVTPPADRVRS